MDADRQERDMGGMLYDDLKAMVKRQITILQNKRTLIPTKEVKVSMTSAPQQQQQQQQNQQQGQRHQQVNVNASNVNGGAA